MENYCNEIGQKMRSAVKAKLLELGTGGSAGYIDDELPDYVMIMVANKRSKQQMINDLNLFLGNQTEQFVNWLHEVLQKLQEVTLPATSLKKRKLLPKEDVSIPTVSKKEKKSTKKEKNLKKSKENIQTSDSVIMVSSITDMFAEELLEKAKNDLDTENDIHHYIKQSKTRKVQPSAENTRFTSGLISRSTNDFDIPTISEISSTTGSITTMDNSTENRNKDLAELAEIQKKINAAKRQLKQLGELDDDNDDNDEDFLNLSDGDSPEVFNEAGDLVRKPLNNTISNVTLPTPTLPSSVEPIDQTPVIKRKSPIIFDCLPNDNKSLNNETKENGKQIKRVPSPTTQTALSSSTMSTKRFNARTEVRHETKGELLSKRDCDKRPVHQRLGVKSLKDKKITQSNVRERCQEKEIYKPSFRRLEFERERNIEYDHNPERKRERGRERDRERDRERERERNRYRERERCRERERKMIKSRENDHNSSVSRDRHTTDSRNKRRSTSEEQNCSQVGKITTTTSAETVRGRSSSVEASPQTGNTQRRRIGSRIIVAPLKTHDNLSDNDDNINQKPVNSVIKIKPRPPVSPSRQASKNLLLKAVADAQRSAIINKQTTTSSPGIVINKSAKTKIALRLGERVTDSVERNTKLYTKSYRDRLKNSSGGVGALFRRSTQNLIVEVNGSAKLKDRVKDKYKIMVNNEEHEEYVPVPTTDDNESDHEIMYVPQIIQRQRQAVIAMDNNHNDTDYEQSVGDFEVEDNNFEKTQFVVTLNDKKTLNPLQHTNSTRYSSSTSPPPQVTSSSSTIKNIKPSTTSQSIYKSNEKDRNNLSSSSTERKSRNIKQLEISETPTMRQQRTELEQCDFPAKYRDGKRKLKDQNTEIEEISVNKKLSPTHSNTNDKKLKDIYYNKKIEFEVLKEDHINSRSTTPPITKEQCNDFISYSNISGNVISSTSVHNTDTSLVSPRKRRHTPIKFDLEVKNDKQDSNSPPKKSQRSIASDSDEIRERDHDYETEGMMKIDENKEKRKISIRHSEAKKYDNLPSSLNSVPVDTLNVYRSGKPKELCKYHPTCTKAFCDYYHPTAPCKAFPNCKFADKCKYTHPKCRYDLLCVNLDCNFAHTGPRGNSLLETSAPPLSSHVVPVQNYKTISVTNLNNTSVGPVSATVCKYFPNCTKSTCLFYHPKLCRYGKNCVNKSECAFYHDVSASSKFKWIASVH